MAEFNNREELEAWLEGRPKAVSVVIAVRAALRVLPLQAVGFRRGNRDAVAGDVVLPVFRDLAEPWVAANYRVDFLKTATGVTLEPGHYEIKGRDLPIGHAVGTARGRSTATGISGSTGTASGRTISASAGSVAASARAESANAANAAYAASKSADGVAAARAAADAVVHAADAAAAAVAATTPEDAAGVVVPVPIIGKVFADPIWEEVSADASFLEGEEAFRPDELASDVLWDNETPGWAKENWGKLKQTFRGLDQDWRVWTMWYEARLAGQLTYPRFDIKLNKQIEIARVITVNAIWEDGPVAVNAEITRLEKEIFGEGWEAGDVEYGDGSTSGIGKADHVSELTIPDQRPAAIEPFWRDGLLTIDKSPLKSDLQTQSIIAALRGLKENLASIADEAEAAGNVDPRAVAYIRSLAENVPEKPPSQDLLFLIAHNEEFLVGYSKTVNDEWPDYLIPRFHAVSLQFQRTMRQFPEWRQFKQNAEQDQISSDQTDEIAEVALALAAELQTEDGLRYVDQAITDALQALSTELAKGQPEDVADWITLEGIEAGKAMLAVDLLESIDNIIKRIAESALVHKIGEVGASYLEGLDEGVTKEAKKRGEKDGAKIVKWTRRILIGVPVAIGGSIGASVASPFVLRLIAEFPDKFKWLELLLKALAG